MRTNARQTAAIFETLRIVLKLSHEDFAKALGTDKFSVEFWTQDDALQAPAEIWFRACELVKAHMRGMRE